ncbi:MAG: hypothetical protein H6976_14610, partial [Gammaproteobacteria bacterium]|nr:hypothetical protein [Gammaproteobacteria bacterium]
QVIAAYLGGDDLAEGTPAEIQANPQVIAAYLGGAVQYAV